MGSTSLSRDTLDQTTLDEIALDCDVPVEAIEDVSICSPLQIATMIESSLRVGSSTFQFAFALGPHIDEASFAKAVQCTVAQNAILRTHIVEHTTLGLLQAVIARNYVPECIVLSCGLDQYLRETRERSMSIGLLLFSTAIAEHKLVLSMHHAVMDHSALTLLMTDVVTRYHGQSPSPRTSYANFVDYCYSVDDVSITKFWSSRFKGNPAIFPSLPSGHVPLATEAIEHHISLDSDIASDAITHIASFIEAALGLTLASYSSNDSVAIGLVLAGRNGLPGDLSSTLGPTIATVPLQINVLSSMTVGSVIKERTNARRELQSSPALHAGMPKIRGASDAASAAAQFQTILNIRPSLADADGAAAEISFDQMHEPSAPFGLCLSCNLQPDCRSMLLEARFDPGVLTQRRVERLVHQFEHRLKMLVRSGWDERLKTLPALNDYDRQEILEWNRTPAVQVCQTLHEMLHQRAIGDPDTIAIEATVGGSATYRELDEMSSRLVHGLRGRDVLPASRVPFIFEKSLWAVVSMLAIMKTGAACVPIERSNPYDRRAELVRSVGAKVVLTSTSEYASNVNIAEQVLAIDGDFIDSVPDTTNGNERLEKIGSGEDLAVILFTSGSTGKPKGVLLEHKNLSSALTSISQKLGLGPGRRILQFAAYAWDISLGEIFGALLFGSTLCVPSEDQRSSGLSQYIQDSHIDWTILTPTVLRTLEPNDLPSLKTVISAGEAISDDIITAWGKSEDFCLFNGWGPCETSVLSAVAKVTKDSPYPDSIGASVGGSLWLINPDRVDDLVPIGSVGEICVAGPAVARGYLDEKETGSAAGFIKPPAWAASTETISSTRFFRTGDLARHNDDGSITFIGRKDHQVKVRGQRFDLGELEATIMGTGQVREVYTTTKIQAGRTEVVAILGVSHSIPPATNIQPLTGEAADEFASCMAAVEACTRSKLPSYMIPSIWIATERLPRTTSAKLDRTAVRDWLKSQDISAIKWNRRPGMTELSPPSTADEQTLQIIWADVLSLRPEDIGRESSFLELGGDSIGAMRAASSLRKKGLSITTATLLGNGSLQDVAKSAPTSSSNSKLWWHNVSDTYSSLELSPGHLPSADVEHVVPATDTQASMLAVGQKRENGYHVVFDLAFEPAVDINQLQTACEAVIQHHGILRTVFVQNGPRLYQVVLKAGSIESTLITFHDGAKPLSAPGDFFDDKPLARFQLMADGDSCTSLRLDIHHALYDAFSLGLLFKDLSAAYNRQKLSSGPPFHAWVSYCEKQDIESALAFWSTTLQESKMSHLVPPQSGLSIGPPLTEKLQLRTPLTAIHNGSTGTPANIVKVAWAILLSFALRENDVVFGDVSFGRSDDLEGIDLVRGPCVNTVPVRARIDSSASLATLIASMRTESQGSLRHQRVSLTKIIRQCTDWPPWSRFGSVLVFQTDGMIENEFKIGKSNVSVSNRGKLGDSADVYIMVTPEKLQEQLYVEISFAPGAISAQQGKWIVGCFHTILKAISTSPDQSIQDLRVSVERDIGVYEPPVETPGSTGLVVANGEGPAPAKIQDVVSDGWREVGLLAADVNGHADVLKNSPGMRNNMIESTTMAECGADIITVLLLSKFYSRQGYDASVRELVQQPTRGMQASLLYSKNSV